MPSRVEIKQTNEIFHKAIFRIVEAKLSFERYDGSMSDEVARMSFERGDGVTAVMHNPEDDTIILIEQFRFPAHNKHAGWILELPAGVLNTNEDPATAMQREIEEETGYRVSHLHHISTFFLSPGGSSERIFLYYARMKAADRISEGGGLDEETEDIKVMHPTIDEALTLLADGKIVDAKTMIGLQWLHLNRDQLPD